MGVAHSSGVGGGPGLPEKCPVSPAGRATFAALAASAGNTAASGSAADNSPAPRPGCPMHQQASSAGATAPSADSSSSSSPAAASPAPPPGCPMHKQGASAAVMGKVMAAAPPPPPPPARTDGPVYNVYSQVIDPSNQMPPPNQSMAPGQSEPLPVERVQSTIPKGGTDSTWLYPSPQMFYNSLVRKSKADNVEVKDVNMVVAIHNEMNERTWKLLTEWESAHKAEHKDGQPKLRRFMGNPYKLSPKARLNSWLGFGFPFDRHDWQVDRGDRQVHYVIDYYYNPAGPANAPSSASDPTAPVLTTGIHVDVRPAVEDLSSALDRLRRFPERALKALRRPRYVAEGIDPSKVPPEELAKAACESESERKRNAVEDAEEAAAAKAARASAAAAAAAAPRPASAASGAGGGWEEVDSRCKPLMEQLRGTEHSVEERRSMQVALNYCLGRALCPSQAGAYMRALESSAKAGAMGAAGGEEEEAFGVMTRCVVDATLARRQQQQQQPEAAGSTALR